MFPDVGAILPRLPLSAPETKILPAGPGGEVIIIAIRRAGIKPASATSVP